MWLSDVRVLQTAVAHRRVMFRKCGSTRGQNVGPGRALADVPRMQRDCRVAAGVLSYDLPVRNSVLLFVCHSLEGVHLPSMGGKASLKKHPFHESQCIFIFHELQRYRDYRHVQQVTRMKIFFPRCLELENLVVYYSRVLQQFLGNKEKLQEFIQLRV